MDINSVNIFAPLNNLGYGVHSYNYVKALKRYYKVLINPIGNIDISKEEASLLDYGFERKSPSIMIFHEQFMNRFTGNPMIGYPVFETNLIDEQSKSLLNQLDYIFVTSRWAKDILLSNHIKEPNSIFIIREGVDTNKYSITIQKHTATNIFTFIHVGKHEERKNTNLIISAFIKAFRNKEANLIMHSYNPFSRTITDFDFSNIVHNREQIGNNTNVYTFGKCKIIFSFPTKDNLNSLYNSANIGIFPSKAEGWNLPLIEALTCGVPSIATFNTGMTEYLEYLKDDMNDLIIYDMEEEIANDGKWFHGNKGSWYTITEKQLIDKMLYAYNNYDKFNRDKISKIIKDNFDWKFTALRTKKVFESI